MAKKKQEKDKNIEFIQKNLDKGIIFIGTEETIKALKRSTVKQVFITLNCPETVKSDIERYCELGGVELVIMDLNNEELGAICRKPFEISVLSIKKDE